MVMVCPSSLWDPFRANSCTLQTCTGGFFLLTGLCFYVTSCSPLLHLVVSFPGTIHGLCYSIAPLLIPFPHEQLFGIYISRCDCNSFKIPSLLLFRSLQATPASLSLALNPSKGFPWEGTRSILCALPGQRPFTSEVLNMQFFHSGIRTPKSLFQRPLANHYSSIREKYSSVHTPPHDRTLQNSNRITR